MLQLSWEGKRISTPRTTVIHKNPDARIDAELRMAQCYGFEGTVTPLTVAKGVEKAFVGDNTGEWTEHYAQLSYQSQDQLL